MHGDGKELQFLITKRPKISLEDAEIFGRTLLDLVTSINKHCDSYHLAVRVISSGLVI